MNGKDFAVAEREVASRNRFDAAAEYLKPLWYWPIAGVILGLAFIGTGTTLAHTPLAVLPYVCAVAFVAAMAWPAVVRAVVTRGRPVGARAALAGPIVAWAGTGIAFGLVLGVSQVVHLEGYFGQWFLSVTTPLAACVLMACVSTWKAFGLVERLTERH